MIMPNELWWSGPWSYDSQAHGPQMVSPMPYDGQAHGSIWSGPESYDGQGLWSNVGGASRHKMDRPMALLWKGDNSIMIMPIAL